MTIADTIHEKLKSAPPEVAREVLAFLEMIEARAARKANPAGPSWEAFLGSLEKSDVFSGDPVEIQRRLREEWDRMGCK